MKIAISTDKLLGAANILVKLLESKDHTVILKGAFAEGKDIHKWANASAEAALEVSKGNADMAIVCCYTGTGATISANKVPNIRAALCVDAFTAMGARTWNNANVLGISLRLTSETVLEEILEAWFKATLDSKQQDNIDYIDSL